MRNKSQWTKKRRVSKRYDATVAIYETRYEQEQKAKYEAILSRLTAENLGDALDVGCGTGMLSDRIAAHVENLVGLDISGQMLKQAKKRAKRFQNVHLVLGDADHLPLRDGTMDHVFAVTLVQNMPDPRATLAEMKRVAKNHATLVVTGLKRVFSEDEFFKLLCDSDFSVEPCEDESLACFVALCRILKR